MFLMNLDYNLNTNVPYIHTETTGHEHKHITYMLYVTCYNISIKIFENYRNEILNTEIKIKSFHLI